MSESKNHSWDGFLPKRAIVMGKPRKKLPSVPEVVEEKTPIVPEVPKKAKDSLALISTDLIGCTRCKLCSTRNQIVFGEGNPQADLVFVGEAPGENEDKLGRPFVGRAGQLLDKMIAAIGLSRQDVFIVNLVKCRPPENRNPEPDEIATCSPFLYRQLEVMQPKVIVALGKFASQALLQTEERISDLRGKFRPYRGVELMPTFHPSYLLRNPSAKKEAWIDLQNVAAKLDLKIPQKQQFIQTQPE